MYSVVRSTFYPCFIYKDTLRISRQQALPTQPALLPMEANEGDEEVLLTEQAFQTAVGSEDLSLLASAELVSIARVQRCGAPGGSEPAPALALINRCAKRYRFSRPLWPLSQQRYCAVPICAS
jgi:hypothetical protein